MCAKDWIWEELAPFCGKVVHMYMQYRDLVRWLRRLHLGRSVMKLTIDLANPLISPSDNIEGGLRQTTIFPFFRRGSLLLHSI